MKEAWNPCSLTLIGMPGAGKTTMGEKIAAMLKYPFIDTDAYLCEQYHAKNIQEVNEKLTRSVFIEAEQAAAIAIVNALTGPTIIATSGSMVYWEPAMEALARKSIIVFLDAPYPLIEHRVGRRPDRNIVYPEGINDLFGLYMSRRLLYQKWAHVTIPVGPDRDRAANGIVRFLKDNRFAA